MSQTPERGSARRGRGIGTGLLLAACLSGAPASTLAQATPADSGARRMSATWVSAPIQDVLRAFAAYSGVSIVAGSGVSGVVTAEIRDQPWDVALQTVLSVNGFVATEDEYGIIRVEAMEDLGAREAIEPIQTRSYRVSYARAEELRAAIAPLLSERGTVSVLASTNTLVVSDIARVQRAVESLLR